MPHTNSVRRPKSGKGIIDIIIGDKATRMPGADFASCLLAKMLINELSPNKSSFDRLL